MGQHDSPFDSTTMIDNDRPDQGHASASDNVVSLVAACTSFGLTVDRVTGEVRNNGTHQEDRVLLKAGVILYSAFSLP